MAVEEQKVEGSPPSLVIDSLESNKSGDALSAEDLAWVDSCLVKDPEAEISDASWSSLKDVLLDILAVPPELHDSSTPGSGGLDGEADVEMHPFSELGGIAQSPGGSDNDFVLTNEESETQTIIDDFLIGDESGNSLSELFPGDLSETSLRNASLPKHKDVKKRVSKLVDSPLETKPSVDSETSPTNAFLPHYKEGNQRGSAPIDSGLDASLAAPEKEISAKDIFKVWDLGIPHDEDEEEDELVKQLNKALSESTIPPMPLTSDSIGSWKDLKEESLDQVIASIADLSLDRRSSSS